MILFFILMFLAVIPYYVKKKHKSFIVIFGGCILVYLLFLIEYFFGGVEYLISDGYRYFANPEEWIVDIDRSLWGFINYFEKYYDIGGSVFIKILNIPILLLFLYYLHKSFPVSRGPYIFVIIYPYLLFLAISNLRDVLIWLFAILIIRNYNKRKMKYYLVAILFSILLYMLRPFMLATLWLGIIIFEVLPALKRLFKKIKVRSVVNFIGLLLLFIIVLILAYPKLKPKIHSYTYNATHLITKGYKERAKLRKADKIIDASNMPKAIFVSHIRYLLTPMPHSQLKRLLTDDFPKSGYGNVSEFLRLYNQIFYYIFFIWVLLNIRSVLKSLRRFAFEQKVFLLWLTAFLPIYSIAHFGGSHQRLKIPFQILIYILFVYTLHYKKNRKGYKDYNLTN